jgi:membrane protein
MCRLALVAAEPQPVTTTLRSMSDNREQPNAKEPTMFTRFHKAILGFSEDQASQMGAALAYYTLFSLTPLLFFALLLLGHLYGEEQSRVQVLAQVSEYLGAEAAEGVRVMLDNFRVPAQTLGLSTISVLALWFGSSGMFASLRTSLHQIWRLKPSKKEGLIKGFLQGYLISIGMVLISTAFLVVLLLASVAMPLLTPTWEKHTLWLGSWGPTVLNLLTSTILLTGLFVFSFRFLSDGRVSYADVLGGAFVTGVLFTIGKITIGSYLAFTNFGSPFGAAGSVVVFLAWVYYSAQILFLGAEIIRFGLPAQQE